MANKKGNVYFLADVHLHSADLSTQRCFTTALTWITQQNPSALWLLGDIFNTWVGDDARAEQQLETVLNAVATAAKQFPVYFMHGNRDFLVGTTLCQTLGITLIPDYHLLKHATGQLLLLHGDAFCSGYYSVQQALRSPEWAEDFLQQPVAKRLAQARLLRDQSQARARPLQDLDLKRLYSFAHSLGASQILHGHTHQPGYHRHQDIQRWSLGEWQQKGAILAQLTPDSGRISLLRFQPPGVCRVVLP